jgi:hypothetical protein
VFEPRNAARERAKGFRDSAAKVEEQLARTRGELKAGREKGSYTTDALGALEDVVALEQLRMLQLLCLAREYEAVAAGGRAFAAMPSSVPAMREERTP